MNTKYSNEVLLHCLPDYISDNLNDTDLKEAIEMKISSDPAFKTEFTNIKETLNIMGPELFELPSDAYFNNLSVRINEAINNDIPSLSLLERFGISLRLVLPVLSVLLIIVSLLVYNTYLNNGNTISENNIDETKITGSDKNIPVEKKPEQELANNDQTKKIDSGSEKIKTGRKKLFPERQLKSDPVIQKTEVSDVILLKDKSVFSKEEEPVTGSLKAKANEDLAFSDNSNSKENISDNNGSTENAVTEQEEDVVISGDTDDDFLEEDIFELTPEEQMEIVEYLKQS